jgi:hypothetical protein
VWWYLGWWYLYTAFLSMQLVYAVTRHSESYAREDAWQYTLGLLRRRRVVRSDSLFSLGWPVLGIAWATISLNDYIQAREFDHDLGWYVGHGLLWLVFFPAKLLVKDPDR